MSYGGEDVRYLIFDIESVADPNLVAAIRHPSGDVAPDEALREYRDELMEKKGSDFIPYTFQTPISLALAKVNSDFAITGLGVLKFEDGGPGELTRRFWKGWEHYRKPTLVTFNGRGFDLPLLELTAFRYGIPIIEWMALGAKSYEQPRNRYNTGVHFDLCDILTNFGATHFSGGLDLASKLIQKPGKIETCGNMVQDLFAEKKFAEIHAYCRCDVLDSYFVFLRTMLLTGRLSPREESDLIRRTKGWLESQVEEVPVYRAYLDAWEKAEKAESLDQYLKRMQG